MDDGPQQKLEKVMSRKLSLSTAALSLIAQPKAHASGPR